MINDLLERKQRNFADNQQMVVSCKLTERPHAAAARLARTQARAE